MSTKKISKSATANDNEFSKSKIESIDLQDLKLTEKKLKAVPVRAKVVPPAIQGVKKTVKHQNGVVITG